MSRKSIFDTLTLYDFKDKDACNTAYVKQFLRRSTMIFEYEGLPDSIPKEYLELYLQYNGFAGICEYKGKLYAFFGGLGGELDEYYRPTTFVVANPYLKLNETYFIDKNCVIIRNDIYMQGLLPIIKRYSTALVENDISMNMVSKNKRQAVFITAPTDNLRKAAQKVIDDIDAGEQSIAADSSFLEGIKVFPLETTHGADITELIEYHQYLRGGLYNELGLNANYNMKREKLNDGETALNQDSLLPLIDEMLMERKVGLDKVNAMFGVNITVKLSETWERVREASKSFSDSERPESEDSEDASEENVGGSNDTE